MTGYSKAKKPETGRICGCVIDVGLSSTEQCKNPIENAEVELFCVDPKTEKPPAPEQCVRTDAEGRFEFCDLKPGKYWLHCCAFSPEPICLEASVEAGCTAEVCFEIRFGFEIASLASMGDCQPFTPCEYVTAGREMLFCASFDKDACSGGTPEIQWTSTCGNLVPREEDDYSAYFDTTNLQGSVTVEAKATDSGGATLSRSKKVRVKTQMAGQSPAGMPSSARMSGGAFDVRLTRSASVPTRDQGLWAAIHSHANAISFGAAGVSGRNGKRTLRGYQGFIEQVLCLDTDARQAPTALKDARLANTTDPCGPTPDLSQLTNRAKQLPMHGMAAYELLKTATEIFLLWNCGVAIKETDSWGNPLTSADEESGRTGIPRDQVMKSLTDFLGTNRLPYIERVVETAFPGYVVSNSVFCTNVLTPRADCVCLIELIWSYWHEEAMLVQTMNTITQRFQNVRSLSDRDPLAHVTIDPLRPLNNLLWGYVQDEQNRLTVKRRGAEYDHEYGITLRGKALAAMRPADSRSKFLEGFHNLLHKCSVFYKEDNDTTVIADGFPLLNALKEVHLLLAQGAHNQFGDLPWAARVEMLIQQWLLARPEMRDFLQSRPMVPYTEAWMPQVDTMKTLQGWSDVTVTHYHDLAAFGEQILLSIRYGDWIDLHDENHAKNWARYWRPEIQSYIHAYRTVTGIDLTNPDTVDYTMPAVHLQKRLALQRAR